MERFFFGKNGFAFRAADFQFFAELFKSLAVFCKATGRKGWMLYAPVAFLLACTFTSLAMSAYGCACALAAGMTPDVVATKDCEVAQAFSLLSFLDDALQGRIRGGDSLGQWLRDNGIRVDFGPLKPAAPTSQMQEVAS